MILKHRKDSVAHIDYAAKPIGMVRFGFCPDDRRKKGVRFPHQFNSAHVPCLVVWR